MFRAVAVVVAGESAPHLYTLFDDRAPADACVHGPLFPDLDDGMDQFANALSGHFSPGARVGIDHFSHAMLRGISGYEWASASGVLNAATLEEGMVLSVQSWVAEEGAGGCLERATVVIEAGGASALTRYERL